MTLDEEANRMEHENIEASRMLRDFGWTLGRLEDLTKIIINTGAITDRKYHKYVKENWSNISNFAISIHGNEKYECFVEVLHNKWLDTLKVVDVKYLTDSPNGKYINGIPHDPEW